jgi:hypothetical protein
MCPQTASLGRFASIVARIACSEVVAGARLVAVALGGE